MKNNTRKEIFDKRIIELSKEGENNKLLNRHIKILKYLYRYCEKEDHILDIGCYDGKILKELENKGYQNLYGSDFSEKSKLSFNNSKIHFSLYDIENDKVPFNNKFDVVIYTDVLEHLYSPERVLENIKHYLNDNGKIFISVPNAGFFLNGLLLSFFPSKLYFSTAFGPWDHIYHFTFYDIKRMSKKLGFKILILEGGKMDNYIFNSGIKKYIFEFLLLILQPLTYLLPSLFSDHIFVVLQK